MLFRDRLPDKGGYSPKQRSRLPFPSDQGPPRVPPESHLRAIKTSDKVPLLDDCRSVTPLKGPLLRTISCDSDSIIFHCRTLNHLGSGVAGKGWWGHSLSPARGVLVVEDRQRRSSLGEEGIIASRFKWDHVDTHRCFPWDKGRRLQSSWTAAKISAVQTHRGVGGVGMDDERGNPMGWDRG